MALRAITRIMARRCNDVKTQKACKQGWEAIRGPNISTALCILPYSNVSTYMEVVCLMLGPMLAS